MSAEDKEMFLSELGLKESGLNRIIKQGYSLLGLISYLTAGVQEVRAWTITNGTKAPQAAGKIHTDFEKGFIRAEIVSFDDLMACGSMAAAKENIHLVSEVSNRNPYIGEPITIAYKIYFRMNIGKAMVSQMPKFNSFWTQVYTENDMPENTSDNREYYKDELYNVVTYYKVLLIPQKEGKFTINPLSINMLAEVGTGQYDYWGDEITLSLIHI